MIIDYRDEDQPINFYKAGTLFTCCKGNTTAIVQVQKNKVQLIDIATYNRYSDTTIQVRDASKIHPLEIQSFLSKEYLTVDTKTTIQEESVRVGRGSILESSRGHKMVIVEIGGGNKLQLISMANWNRQNNITETVLETNYLSYKELSSLCDGEQPRYSLVVKGYGNIPVVQ